MKLKRNQALIIILVLLLQIIVFSCGKKEDMPHMSVMPQIEGAELEFRGFVADDEDELLSDIHKFSRRVVHKDTIDHKVIHYYISSNQRTPFYTDKEGTVWERQTEDVSVRMSMYGYFPVTPIKLSYWKALLKVDSGVGSQWEVNIDTTFQAKDIEGKKHVLRYVHQGKARNEGWTTAFIPEVYQYVDAVDAHWYELNTFLINETSGDSLYISRGTAHQYFEPKLGAIKYITDFIQKEQGKEPISLHGTWELLGQNIPEQNNHIIVVK